MLNTLENGLLLQIMLTLHLNIMHGENDMKYNECGDSTLTIIDDDNEIGYAKLQLYHWNSKQRRKQEKAIKKLISKRIDDWIVEKEEPYYFATAKPPQHGFMLMFTTRNEWREKNE